MKTATAIAALKRHEAQLRNLGVESISLFGSAARGEAKADSDVDLAVTLKGVPRGFAYFGRLDRSPPPSLVSGALSSRIACVPSSRPTDRFNDIIYNIDAIARYTQGMTKQQFLTDARTFDATQHCLLRISEAAKKLGALAKELVPDQPWRDIRGIGNRLRHEYDKIDRRQIWEIVVNDLAPLRAGCMQAIVQIHTGFERASRKAPGKPRKR
jgi:uncharacterized protein with HEPN domain